MGRNLDFFKNEGSKINDEVDLKNPEDDFYLEKFEQTLDDWRDGKIGGEGYDPANIVHKNTKEMEKWKQSNVNLFNQ